MKVGSLLPFVAILLAGGIWLVRQRQSISSVEMETSFLRQRVEAARPAIPVKSLVQESSDEKVDDPPFDWQELLSKPPGNDPDEAMRFQKRLEAMTGEEITEVLDEIAGLDLPEASRDQLAKMFFGSLIKKDPEMAMNRFSRPPDPRNRFSLPDPSLTWGLSRWAEADPARASAWLDSKIANGELVSKSLVGVSPYRVQYENALIHILTPSNPAAVEKRLVAMSEDEAARVLASLASEGGQQKTDPMAVAKLVRTTLPEKRALEIISNEASSQGYKDRAGAITYLDSIQATPAERTAGIQQVAGAIIYQLGSKNSASVEAIDDLRSWVKANQTGSTDLVMGDALAHAVTGEGLGFDEASTLLLHCFEKSSSEDVIIGFLTHEDSCSPDQARTLAEKISNPAKRAEILEKIR